MGGCCSNYARVVQNTVVSQNMAKLHKIWRPLCLKIWQHLFSGGVGGLCVWVGGNGRLAKRARVISAQCFMSHSLDCVFTYHTQFTHLQRAYIACINLLIFSLSLFEQAYHMTNHCSTFTTHVLYSHC